MGKQAAARKKPKQSELASPPDVSEPPLKFLWRQGQAQAAVGAETGAYVAKICRCMARIAAGHSSGRLYPLSCPAHGMQCTHACHHMMIMSLCTTS